MPKLKVETFDPFGVAEQAPPPVAPESPAVEVAVDPAPAPVKKRTRPAKARPPAPEPGPTSDPGAAVPPLFARVSAADDDWLREVRYRHRVPSSALVRALIRLAREDEDLLGRALGRARADMATERPGPRKA